MLRPALMLATGLTLALVGVACGGGGGSGPAPVLAPEITAVDVDLDGLAGTAFVISGANFPGASGDSYVIRFQSTGTPIFDDCNGLELTGTVDWASPSTLTGIVPATHVLADSLTYVTVDFPAGAVTSEDPIARFLGTPDPDQDQDGNGVRDGCDPNTYDFEADTLGAVPAETTHLGFPTAIEVAEVGGDQVARYVGGSSGSHDRLDRLSADVPQQDTTVYVDWDATDSVGTIELWSEGSWSDNAGAGLIVQIRDGLIYFFERTYRAVPSVVGPALPANGRMRIRVLKGTGTTSAVHVDTWDGSAWNDDYVVFPVADDRAFRGRAVVLAEYSGSLRGIKRITAVHTIPAAPLTVAERPEGLTPWKLFQRDSGDVATIPVHALYRLADAGRLEARVVQSDNGLVLPGHDFADHGIDLDAAPDGGRAQLDLVGVPVGGNYDVRVRLLDATGALISQVGVNDVAVGDVYVCAGQSNMSGYSGNLVGATQPTPEVHRYGNDGRWDQAVEAMDDGTDQLDAVSREFPFHSLMLPFARRLYDATGIPVALVPTSLGGTNLYAQWQRNATDPDWRATLYGSMLHRARIATGGMPPAGFLWFQGESDALAARTTAQYVADLEQLIQQVRTDLAAPDLPAVVAQLGTFSSAPLDLWLGIQEAQRQVALQDTAVALVTTNDAPRSDAIHFSVSGYQTIGERFGDAMRRLKFEPAFDPLTELVSVAQGTTADRVVLTYDANVAGGDASLYAVRDDTGAATVTSITVSGATVTLNLDRALGTNPTVDYGLAVLPTAAWVVDGDGVPVPAFRAVPVN
ncbi:MAG: sialate O-acetylesterase [Planctomycetota bacterium]|nr:sialate O-acetylesterase [Planctomycetota bacterium]